MHCSRTKHIPTVLKLHNYPKKNWSKAMTRKLITAAAQMGPISKSETRADTVSRLLEMMREAKARGLRIGSFY